MGYKFRVGPRNEAHVPKFLPPSCRPLLLLSSEKAGWQHHGEASTSCRTRKRRAAVCRSNGEALSRMRWRLGAAMLVGRSLRRRLKEAGDADGRNVAEVNYLEAAQCFAKFS